jgi:PAS domain S-box-containing protein
VLLANDGAEALECAVLAQPDLILVDVNTSRIDPFVTCRNVKRDGRTRDISVICLISLADEVDRVKGFAAGCADYLIKPVRVDELLARVRVYLELRAMQKRFTRQNAALSAEVGLRKEVRSAHVLAREQLELSVASGPEDLARANEEFQTQIERRGGAGARLTASEAQFRTIVETSPVPMCVVSIVEGNVLCTNEPLRRLLGIREGATNGATDVFADAGERERLAEDLYREGEVSGAEVRLRRPDGSEFWAIATARTANYGDVPVIYLGIMDITVRVRREHDLIEACEQQRRLSAHMESIREEERKQVATEIHDEVGQLLAALKIDVSLLKMQVFQNSELVKNVDDMLELVEGTMWMLRNVASHLRPAALKYGVVSALEWLVAEFNRANTVLCELRVQGPEPALPDARATAIFRIVQSSLTNIARHANATRAEVTVISSSSAVELHVYDNGRGFDQFATRCDYSYGLLSMSERARQVGASLSIDSVPGAGTMISIHVPSDDPS